MAALLQIKMPARVTGEQVLLERCGGHAWSTTSKFGFRRPERSRQEYASCAVLLGEEELDRGEIVRHPKLRLGYLRQHDPFLPGGDGRRNS